MPEPAGATVSVREVTKRYGAVTAVRSASFEVGAGEIFGLLGPNGAGKTTLLECLLGLRQVDEGRIAINGLDVGSAPHATKQLVGAQLQSAALQEKITPHEALSLFQSLYGRPANPLPLLERFGLLPSADVAFGTLSGGQRQRLFLALAFINDPALLVLDEPTAGLDPISRRDLHTLIAAQRAAGGTVLLSTHDLEEAEQLCDRVGIIDTGRMVAVAPPAELIARTRNTSCITGVTKRPLPMPHADTLPAVVQVEQQDTRWQLHTTDVPRTITALMKLLEQDANPLQQLHVRRPTLDDVFFELTGRRWAPESEERM